MKRGVLECPKLPQLARLLGVRLAEARGLLENLLDWTYYQAIRGDIGKWNDAEIAAGARFEGPQDFIGALVEARWVDRHRRHRLVIHDLHEHADDAWKKQLQRMVERGVLQAGFANQDPPGKGRTRTAQRPDKDRTLPACRAEPSPEEPSRAAQGVRAEELLEAWNANCGLLPKAVGLSDTRRKHARARLEERPLDEWVAIIERIAASSFCRGGGSTGWRASFSWLIESPEVALKVLEGKYDNGKANGPVAPTGPRMESAADIFARQEAEMERKRRAFEAAQR